MLSVQVHNNNDNIVILAKNLLIQRCFRRIHHLEGEVAASCRPISDLNFRQLLDTAL